MESTGIFPGLGIPEMIIILAALIVITFHILMIAHVLRKKNYSVMRKGIWVLAIVCLPIAGALAYRLIAYADTPKVQ